jgi:hypothetical protein
MTERDRTAAFVEDVLARAGVPSRREREDVRRELLTHFEDTVRERGSIDAALAEFGSVDEIASRFAAVYRARRLLTHALRIAAGLTVSVVAALGIELALGRPDAVRAMTGFACAIVLGLALWRELVSRRLRQPTTMARAGRWLAAFLALTAYEYGIHHYAGIPLGVLAAAATSGVLVTIAASTAIIMTAADRAFGTLVQPHDV